LSQVVHIPRTRYKRLGKLSPSPRPCVINRSKRTVTIFYCESKSLAYVLGAIIGDGSIKSRRLSFYNSDPVLLEGIRRELTTISPIAVPRILPPRPSGVASIEFPDSALTRLFSTLREEGLPAHLTANPSFLSALVAGLFDADGSAGIYMNESHPKGGPQVTIYNSNLPLLEQLRQRLLRLKIVGGISLANRPKTSKIDGRAVVGRKIVYRLRFTSWSSATNLARFILPYAKSHRKRDRLKAIVTKDIRL